MRILVIDDAQKHLDAALETLNGHNVTICSSYDEAMITELKEKYVDAEGNTCSKWEEDAVKIPYWDAVLCDLLMPVGERTHGQSKRRCVGEEMPLGFCLALTAAIRGAKYVAIATDTNHHDHPASAMLDTLDGHIFQIDGAKVIMTNRLEFTCPQDEECSNCDMRKYGCNQESCQTARGGKDWGKLLDRLLKG